ncbi:hypothetical protein AB0B57_19370 [Micromonospora sp. NPDC049101]|uniref:hypothetical protein n=1 Tax=Micromonospora sp. NPDC049101 TaxID=3155032 RepID=UPI0033F572F0
MIATLNGCAAAIDKAVQPGGKQRMVARVEGWFALPTGPLSDLIDAQKGERRVLMASRLGWLDSPHYDQDRLRELLKLFSDTESRDDLGVGLVRDPFSGSGQCVIRSG